MMFINIIQVTLNRHNAHLCSRVNRPLVNYRGYALINSNETLFQCPQLSYMCNPKPQFFVVIDINVNINVICRSLLCGSILLRRLCFTVLLYVRGLHVRTHCLV